MRRWSWNRPNLAHACTLFAIGSGAAFAAPRDVQIRSINFATGVVELHNFGAVSQNLSGFQFCTQDENETLRYTGPMGLNGRTIAPGGSLFIHYNNDAAAVPERINRTALGGLMALPLDNTAHSLSLYFPPVNFNLGTTMADHAMWNINGADDVTADERADEAQAGGVWTDQSAWIATTPSTTYIRLLDLTGGILHGPSDYLALDALPDCNENGVDDFFDIAAGEPDADMNGIPDVCETGLVGDMNCDGFVTVGDISGFVLALTDPAGYAIAFPTCDVNNADINEDGFVTVGDISGFVALLTGQ